MADLVREAPRPLTPPKADPVVSRRRFGAAYLLLAAIVGAAVGLIVVLAGSTDNHHRTASGSWSSWKPTTTGTLGVRDIARHVSGQYHLENGALFTSVIGGPMQIESGSGPIPVSAILIRSGTAGVPQERIDIAFPKAGVFYQLVGTGPNRTIPGAATLARGRLVRREALELALYTFHYLPADYVLAFLPPPAGVSQQSPLFSRAVLLSRENLKDELSVPLEQSLPGGVRKLTPSTMPVSEGNAVEGITHGMVFHYDFQQAADNSVLVVLSPLP